MTPHDDSDTFVDERFSITVEMRIPKETLLDKENLEDLTQDDVQVKYHIARE